jgi:hypothetical protein
MKKIILLILALIFANEIFSESTIAEKDIPILKKCTDFIFVENDWTRDSVWMSTVIHENRELVSFFYNEIKEYRKDLPRYIFDKDTVGKTQFFDKNDILVDYIDMINGDEKSDCIAKHFVNTNTNAINTIYFSPPYKNIYFIEVRRRLHEDSKYNLSNYFVYCFVVNNKGNIVYATKRNLTE